MSPWSNRAYSASGGPPSERRTIRPASSRVQRGAPESATSTTIAASRRLFKIYVGPRREALSLFLALKDAPDSILRPEQAAYLDALHRSGARSFSPSADVGHSVRDALLVRMEARAADRGYPISDPEVAAFLAVTARAVQPRLVVELGTNIGYAAIVLARAAVHARVVTIEYRLELCEEARAYIAEAGLTGRIEVRHGLAIAELEKIDEPIDFIYIDCVKEEYPRYLELAVSRLSERGVVVADNVLWKGLVARSVVPEQEKARCEARLPAALRKCTVLKDARLPLPGCSTVRASFPSFCEPKLRWEVNAERLAVPVLNAIVEQNVLALAFEPSNPRFLCVVGSLSSRQRPSDWEGHDIPPDTPSAVRVAEEQIDLGH